jgi:hypothetical protein
VVKGDWARERERLEWNGSEISCSLLEYDHRLKSQSRGVSSIIHQKQTPSLSLSGSVAVYLQVTQGEVLNGSVAWVLSVGGYRE